MINNNRRSNSKLAQFKAAVAHLPFTSFDESNDDIVATYSNSSIDIEVGYNPNLLGTSCNFVIYRNDVQTDSYGTYDIDEFVEQLEPYFNLGNEVSLLKQLDRRLTKLEMYNNLAQQELDDNSEVEDELSLLLQEEYQRGFVDGLRGYPSDAIGNGLAIGTNSKLGYGALGVSRVKELELDELSKVGYVKRKDGKLVKRKFL